MDDRKELHALREHVYKLTEEETVPPISIADMERAIAEKKIVFIGGIDSWSNRLKGKFAIGWVIAGVLFVIDTKVIPYLATFALMYFVEKVISVSLFGGMQMWSAIILVWGIRLVCFSYMAALITFMINFSKEYDSSYMKNPEFSSHFMEGNIFKVCSAFAKVYKDA